MLRKLYLDNCFLHNDRTFVFDKGLTAITGKNESGKSLIAEMVRFALFGSKALRGESSDYNNLHVELDFDVKEDSYKVIRKKGNAQLFRDDTQIASGTSVVNKVIPEILGYDLQVFDTANSCNQGSVEALSDMRPTERRKMVDQTIGLNVLDELLTWVGEQSLVNKRLVDTLEPTLEKPDKPEKPENYRSLDKLRKDLNELDAKVATKNRLSGLLTNAPENPGDRPKGTDNKTAKQLSESAEARRITVEEIASLSRKIAQCEPPTITVEQIADLVKQYEDHSTYVQFTANNPKPIYTLKKLNHFRKLHKAMDDYKRIKGRQKWLEEQLQQMQGELVTCPECSHDFSLAPEMFYNFKKELDELVIPKEPTEESPLQIDQINNQSNWIEVWIDAPAATDDPGCTKQELAEQTHLNEILPKRHGWETELEKLQANLSEEISPDLINQLAIWEREIAVYDDYADKVKDWTAELSKLSSVETKLASTRKVFDECSIYETLNEFYKVNLTKFDDLTVTIQGYKDNAKAFSEAKVVIQGVKTEIKTLLLPSLNTVASRFLEQMTGGERSIVEIDEDFEILIDGTKLITLSGSGRAVANLAIRLALGQVLTNRVFSVFIADEVDASMDDERAAYTAECLRRLTDLIGQVMLITHKYPEADQSIELTK